MKIKISELNKYNPETGKTYILVDGYHRVQAFAKLHGVDAELEVEVLGAEDEKTDRVGLKSVTIDFQTPEFKEHKEENIEKILDAISTPSTIELNSKYRNFLDGLKDNS